MKTMFDVYQDETMTISAREEKIDVFKAKINSILGFDPQDVAKSIIDNASEIASNSQMRDRILVDLHNVVDSYYKKHPNPPIDIDDRIHDLVDDIDSVSFSSMGMSEKVPRMMSSLNEIKTIIAKQDPNDGVEESKEDLVTPDDKQPSPKPSSQPPSSIESPTREKFNELLERIGKIQYLLEMSNNGINPVNQTYIKTAIDEVTHSIFDKTQSTKDRIKNSEPVIAKAEALIKLDQADTTRASQKTPFTSKMDELVNTPDDKQPSPKSSPKSSAKSFIEEISKESIEADELAKAKAQAESDAKAKAQAESDAKAKAQAEKAKAEKAKAEKAQAEKAKAEKAKAEKAAKELNTITIRLANLDEKMRTKYVPLNTCPKELRDAIYNGKRAIILETKKSNYDKAKSVWREIEKSTNKSKK